MEVEVFHRKSPLKAVTEDAYAVNSDAGLFAVMDGVTPLHPYKDADGHNGAYLAARLFQAYFEQGTVDTDLAELVRTANRRLRAMMDEAQIDPNVLHELWSTCVAAVKVEADRVRYAQLGDSMILAVYRDGRVDLVTEDRVQGLSARARSAREEARRRGETLPEESYFDVPLHRNRANRWMANRPDGYGVANGMTSIDVHLQTGELPLEELSHLVLMTDGMFHPELELTAACARMLQTGLAAYADEVAATEAKLQAQPDDRTCIWLRL